MRQIAGKGRLAMTVRDRIANMGCIDPYYATDYERAGELFNEVGLACSPKVWTEVGPLANAMYHHDVRPTCDRCMTEYWVGMRCPISAIGTESVVCVDPLGHTYNSPDGWPSGGRSEFDAVETACGWAVPDWPRHPSGAS